MNTMSASALLATRLIRRHNGNRNGFKSACAAGFLCVAISLLAGAQTPAAPVPGIAPDAIQTYLQTAREQSHHRGRRHAGRHRRQDRLSQSHGLPRPVVPRAHARECTLLDCIHKQAHDRHRLHDAGR